MFYRSALELHSLARYLTEIMAAELYHLHDAENCAFVLGESLGLGNFPSGRFIAGIKSGAINKVLNSDLLPFGIIGINEMCTQSVAVLRELMASVRTSSALRVEVK